MAVLGWDSSSYPFPHCFYYSFGDCIFAGSESLLGEGKDDDGIMELLGDKEAPLPTLTCNDSTWNAGDMIDGYCGLPGEDRISTRNEHLRK